MDTRDAIEAAYEKDLDLFVVAPNAKPPVAKFMDYNKHKFEQQKKEREARKKQKTQELKEIRLSPRIDVGDFNTKLKKGRGFLEKGDKLKLSIRLRGREMAYKKEAIDVILRYANECEDIATILSQPKVDNRNIDAMLAPIKTK
jgi:translation initiation factor IF-3